jgi:hypothetical protein
MSRKEFLNINTQIFTGNTDNKGPGTNHFNKIFNLIRENSAVRFAELNIRLIRDDPFLPEFKNVRWPIRSSSHSQKDHTGLIR